MSTAERIKNDRFEVVDTDIVESINSSSMKISDLYIGSISSGIKTLNPDTNISVASQMIRTDPMLPGFCIINNGELLGVVTKNQLHAKLSSKYGYSLYSNKEIELIMCKDFLCVDFFTPIDIVIKIAMQRDPDKIYDFITVTKGKKYSGIVTVKDLLEKSIPMGVVNTLQAHSVSAHYANTHAVSNFEITDDAPDKSFILDFDIDSFNAYNDVYGSEKGDIVMERFMQILNRSIPQEFFVGQTGEDDFVAIALLADAEKICRKVVEQFDEMTPDFYSETDLMRGYVLTKNNHGIEEVYPLMSLTVAGIPAASFLGFSDNPAPKIKNTHVQVLHEHIRSKNVFA